MAAVADAVDGRGCRATLAFLRAINVGGRVVKMERLRALFAELGFAKVETLIASGNVIFETRSKSAEALEKKIERHLRETLGYEVITFLRSAAEVAAVAAHRPFPATEVATDGAVVYVAFLKKTPTPTAMDFLTSQQSAVDAFQVSGREVYWLCRKRFSESEFSGARLEKLLGMPMTVRNSTTVSKLAAKLA